MQEVTDKPKPKRTAAQEAARRQLEFKPTPSPQKAPAEKPMSLGGFGENLLQNAWDIAKGFVNVFPTALKSGAEVFGDPEGLALLAQNPEHLVNAFRDTAKHLGNSIVHPYEKHGARVLYEEPLTPVLDALTVLSLGGGGIAKAGRLAGNAKLVETGTKIAGIPERLAGSIGRGVQKAVGINPETRQGFLRIRRMEHAGAKMEAGVWKDKILGNTKDLTPNDWALVDRLIHEGGKAADLASNPRAAHVYGELQKWLKAEREAELGSKGRALLDDKQMESRIIAEMAERKGKTFAEAALEYKGLDVKPIYAPAIKESTGQLVNAFSPSVIKKGKVGFLERWETSLGATKDPRLYIVRAVDDFYKMRGNLRMIDRVMQTPGWAKAVKAGDVTLGELLPNGGILQKYYTDRSRSRSLFVDELTQKHGQERANQLIRSDPATQKALNMAVNVAIPDNTLRNLIRREFTQTGGDWGAFLRVVDRVTDLFRMTATKLNPRWYTGNVVGDALLASMAGSNWGLAKRLMQQHVLPRTLQSGAFGQAAETGNRLNKLSDFVGAIDDAARAGIFSKAVADKLRNTALHFSASEETLRLAAAEVSLAPNELADIMVKNQMLGEHVARQSRAVQRLDVEIAKARKELNDALGAEAKVQAKLMEPAVEGRPVDLSTGGTSTLSALEKEREKLAVQLQRGKLPFNERQKVVARLQEIDRAKPEISLQRGEGVDAGVRRSDLTEAAQAKLDQLLSTRETYLADLTKNMMAREVKRIPELRRKAEIAEQAIDRANAFLGEYYGLGPIERGVFRRLIPFYPWTKAMSKLAFNFPFLSPGKAFFWHRYAGAMTEMMGDPELPEWLAPYAPVFVRQNGDTVWARITSMSPFGALRTEHVGGVPIPSIVSFWQSNPWVSLGFRLAGGRDTFNPGQIPYGEPLVAINDGEVYEFNQETGKLERRVVQAPLGRSAFHLFPVVQMIDQLISNYDVRKGSPVLNSDGSVKYPLELHQRLLDLMGVKLMHRNREDAIRMEKVKVRRSLEELKKQYRKAGPEEREFIKGVFEDYQRGEYRRIEAR